MAFGFIFSPLAVRFPGSEYQDAPPHFFAALAICIVEIMLKVTTAAKIAALLAESMLNSCAFVDIFFCEKAMFFNGSQF